MHPGRERHSTLLLTAGDQESANVGPRIRKRAPPRQRRFLPEFMVNFLLIEQATPDVKGGFNRQSPPRTPDDKRARLG